MLSILAGGTARAQFPLPYCNVSLPDAGRPPITSVVFAGISRTSSAATGGAELEDFLSDTATVIPGLPYIITVKGHTNGNWTHHIRVYVDWNNNHVFTDAGESYDIGSLTNSTGTDAVSVSDTIIAPLTASLGNTRMRVIKKQGTAINNRSSCPTSGEGQAEDYTVNVIQSPVCLTPRGLTIDNISGASVAFSWDTMHGVNGYEYVVDNSPAPPPGAGTPAAAPSGSVATLAGSTHYYIHVRSDCGGGDYSDWAVVSFVTCPPPTGLLATNITHYSATLFWDAVSGVSGYEYIVDQTAGSPSGAGTNTTATTAQISTLTAATTYYLHVRTDCGGGTYSGWTTYSFITDAAYCLLRGTFPIMVTDLLPTEAMLSGWSPSPFSAGIQSGYEYVLDQSSAAPAGAGTALADTFWHAANLQPGTVYYMHVRLQCSGGLFSFWMNKDFTTPACVAPSGLAAAGITDTSAMLTWDAIAGAPGYEYVIDQSAADPAAGTPVTDTFVHASSLSGGNKYYLHVRAGCGSGTFSFWRTMDFSTPACYTAPDGLGVTDMIASSATFIWNPVPGAADYEYAVDQSPADPAAGTLTADTFAQVPGLTGGARYYLHVRTSCGSGDVSQWATDSFVLCAAPTGLAAGDISDTGATVSWHAVAGAAGYEYAVDLPATPPAAGGTPTTDTGAAVLNLQGSTTYYLHVRSKCDSVSFSGWETLPFTTAPSLTVEAVTAGSRFSFHVYPNPVTGQLGFVVKGAAEIRDAVIQVTDITGKTVQTVPVAAREGTVNMSGLDNGIYFIRYADGAHYRVTRVSKQ